MDIGPLERVERGQTNQHERKEELANCDRIAAIKWGRCAVLSRLFLLIIMHM